jgi:hypothetical protein
MRISFLSASVALTKSFHKQMDGSIKKHPYPLVSNFTSHTEEFATLAELFKLIKTHAAQGHCLLKGELDRPIVSESRKSHTTSEGETQWICLDFDRLPSANVETELATLGLDDIAHIVQYSSSQGMPGTEGTISCHVFMMLSAPMRAPELKLWLQNLNFKHYPDKIRLSRNHAALCYPVDVTTCQNDKLLYIATPGFSGMPDPMPQSRLTLVKPSKALLTLPIERIGTLSPEVTRTKAQEIKNRLRKALGLKATNAGIVFIGEHEVQNKPGESSVTGIKDCGEFTRLNLNGGDSWAYWHPNNNFELLFNFKGEPAYKLKEICPAYYADLMKDQITKNASPTQGGDRVLLFRDKATSSYWNGTYNDATGHLDLFPARSETQCEHFMMSHGLTYVPPIPIWSMEYDPHAGFKVDFDNNTINLFQPSSYMLATDKETRKVDLRKQCPTIYKVLTHMIGGKQDVLDEFLNWLACFYQRKGKPITAWVCHGIEGTGKGTLFYKIIRPLFGASNTTIVMSETIEDSFTEWKQNKLMICVDEADHSDFQEKGKMAAMFRQHITDATIHVRAMRTASVEVPNYFGMLFFSNKGTAVHISKTDRRYNVADFQREKLGDKLAEGEYDKIDNELEHFAFYVASLEADVSRASKIYQTEARERMQKLSLTSLETTAQSIINGDFEALWSAMPDQNHLDSISTMDVHAAYASAYATLMIRIARDIIETGGKFMNRLTRDELYTMFAYLVNNKLDRSVNKFTTLLGHMGIETKRFRRGEDRFHGYEVKNWYASDELIKILDEETQPKKPKLRLAQK